MSVDNWKVKHVCDRRLINELRSRGIEFTIDKLGPETKHVTVGPVPEGGFGVLSTPVEHTSFRDELKTKGNTQHSCRCEELRKGCRMYRGGYQPVVCDHCLETATVTPPPKKP